MNCILTFEYEYSSDGDSFGWLIARVETPNFVGANGTWVQWQDVVKFGEALARYPIEAADPVICEWGFTQDEEYEVVTQVAVAPQGATGGLIVEVFVANCYDREESCRTRFHTDYPAVARFREQIERMMQRDIRTAALSGSSEAG